MIGVAPQDEAGDYSRVFRRIKQTIQITEPQP
jgi:hypothetical protein